VADNREPASSSCDPVVQIIEEHLIGAQLQAKADAIVAANLPDSGIGDALSDFLAVLTIAVATGRRMEVMPDHPAFPGYISETSFVFAFNATFTGNRGWLAESVAWRRHAQLAKHNKSLRQYKPAGSEWGATFAHGQHDLASRLLVPSPSGRYPPTHKRDLKRGWELFIAGNVGGRVFRTYFARRLAHRNISYSPQHMACALQYVLVHPTDGVKAEMARLRPYATSAKGGLVGVHIRSEAYLISRQSGSDAARYSGSAIDRGDRTVFAGCRNENGRFEPTSRQLSNYSEFWFGCRIAATWLANSLASREESAEQPFNATRQRYDSIQWLLVSDDAELKWSAQASLPGRLLTTSLTPTHVGVCGARAQSQRQSVEETVAEMLLLAESRVLLFSRSRFPVSALLLSRSCQKAFYLRRVRGSCARPEGNGSRKTSLLDLLEPWQRGWRSVVSGVNRCMQGALYAISTLHDQRGLLTTSIALDEF